MYSFKRDKASQCQTTLGTELVKRPALRGRALSTDRLGLVEGMPYAPRPQYWSVLYADCEEICARQERMTYLPSTAVPEQGSDVGCCDRPQEAGEVGCWASILRASLLSSRTLQVTCRAEVQAAWDLKTR